MSQGSKKHILKLFSANTLQIAFSQGGALIVFWLASKEMSKQDFGSFNWFFAIYGTAAAILSFGLDFIVIKRVSSVNDVNAARLQFTLTLFFSLLSIPVLLYAFSPGASEVFRNSAFIMVAFQCTFLGMPFKNVLIGREFFTRSAAAVICSNSLKAIAMLVLWANGNISLLSVSLVLAVGNFTELCVYAFNAWSVLDKRLLPQGFVAGDYKTILLESLPQLGVIVFDSAFARIDWILLGTLSSGDANTNTAEYSFAYKIFEVSRLPLLILAPLLFTRFSKLFHHQSTLDANTKQGIRTFFAIGLTGGLVIPVLLNFIWVPVMQFFTSGKYGPENHHIYFLLSATLPFIYMINFLWTMAFAQGQLRLTMLLSLCNSVLNILLNVLLIPRWGQTGAAIAFLACNVVMAPFYIYLVRQLQLKFPFALFLKIVTCAVLTSTIVWFLPLNGFVAAGLATLVFLGSVFILKILTFADIRSLKFFLKDN